MAEITILHYRRVNGEVPIKSWLDSIDDKVALASVMTRIDRLASGTFGDWKPVGGGVGELRVHLGPGYRIYFGRSGKKIVILLAGGIKRSQKAGIKTAQEYWKDYEARTKTHS